MSFCKKTLVAKAFDLIWQAVEFLAIANHPLAYALRVRDIS
jgi:hypothetical protein